MLVPDTHRERRVARADRKRLVAQLSGEVEGLSRRLLARHPKRVLGDLRLDTRSHRGRRSEEPIRGRQSFDPLVRTLEVVVLDEESYPPLAVLVVGEHRPRQQLLPQRFPEPLDLPAGLRMLRPALHVRDAVAFELGFELRRATPGRVLAALVGQDLFGRSVLGDAARERFQHQHASLVMRHRQTHEISRVIIQERRHI